MMNIKIFPDTMLRNLTVIFIAFLLSSCGSDDKGIPVGLSIPLAVDTTLELYCESEGIAGDRCVLEDPNNPYARSDVNDITKWLLNDASPSNKSKFYLWATALARNPTGENQYYTALALHGLYTEGSSLNAREQAKMAYRSVMDNYFDSLTFFNVNKPLEFRADVDFFFGEWGSGSSLDGAYSKDTDFSSVFQVAAGSGWGAPTATLAFTGIKAGTIANYNNLEFKIKNLPTNTVTVKFSYGPNTGTEVLFDLTAVATDIPGTTGWKRVSIPLSNFPDGALYTEFGIHTGFGKGGTFLITDIAFTGDATGNGLFKDQDGDGAVFLYKTDPGTVQLSIALRHLAGRNIVNPGSQSLLQLYFDKNYADSAIQSWGYVFDPGTGRLERKP